MTDPDRAKNISNNSAKLVDRMNRQDYWVNSSTGIGTSYDRHRNMRQAQEGRPEDLELDAYYIDNDIAATVVDRVAEEAMRQGYSLAFEDSDPGEADEIVKWAEAEYQVAACTVQARKWARLYGGSGLLIGADNGQDLTEPLQEGFDVRFLRPFPRPDLEAELWYNDEEDILTEKFGLPQVFRATVESGMGGHYSASIHESRFHIMQGVLTTNRRFLENRGWGDSVLTRVIDILKRFDGSWISIMHILTDSSVPIYKIKDFMSHLESDQLDALIARLALIDQQKNNMRPVVLDADGESYERIAAELTDVSAVLQNTMIRMSAAAKLPVSILFGQAPAGLNASPEGDLRNFYDKVDVERKTAYRPALLHIYRMLLSQRGSPTRGRIPEGLTIKFPSLWQTDPVQAATLYQMRSTADGVNIANGVLMPEEVAIDRAASAEPFGFPDINLSARKELLDLLNNPEGILEGTPGAAGGPNMPSNAVLPGARRGTGGDETGAPEPLTVESEPQKATLSGAQIKMLQELAEAVAQGALPKASAEAIVASSFPMLPESIAAIFADIEDVYAESSPEERLELRALPFGGVSPGSDGQVGEGAPQEEEEEPSEEEIPEATEEDTAEEISEE